MTTAFALNALFAGVLIFGAAAALSSLIRGRAAYLIALLAFFLAVAAPFWMTRPESSSVTDGPYQPAISVDAQTPVFTPVWIAGTLLLLGRELRGHIGLARIRGRRLTGEEKAKLGWPLDDDRIELVDVPPMTLASRVLISSELLEGTPIEVARAIVRHERAHLRWRDPVVGAGMRLVLALFWTALPLWLLDRLVRREREAAADAEALQGVAEREDYAEALLRLARGASAGAAVGFASELEHRVRRLFRDPAPPLGRIAALTAAVVTAAAVALVPVVSFDRRGAHPTPPAHFAPVTAIHAEPVAAVTPRRTRRQGKASVSLESLPTGSQFGEIAAPRLETIPPVVSEIESKPVAMVSEVTAPVDPGFADQDVRVDVRRHVIGIKR